MSDETHEIQKQNRDAAVGFSSRGVQLTTLDEAWRWSQCVVRSGLAPRDFNTPEKVLIAVQSGLEIGLSLMQSLQSIAVINGRPCIWGDALPAIVHGSGVCEYVKDFMDGDGDDYGCTVISKRKDQSEPLTTRFTVAMAKKAGLWGKRGPWESYPDRMLKMRARAYNFRDNFADVLRGVGVREEVEDYEPSNTIRRVDNEAFNQTEDQSDVPVNDAALDELCGDTPPEEPKQIEQAESTPLFSEEEAEQIEAEAEAMK